MVLKLEARAAVEGEEEPTVELFTLNDVVYSIPDRARPAVAMNYLYICRTRSVGIAESWLAEEMLGTDAYLALLNFKDLTSDELEEIMSMARAVVFGEVRPKESEIGARSRMAPAKKRSSTSKTVNGS